MAENFFGITDVGRLRENNEDAFIAEKIGNKNIILACVIDGVGGYDGGEVAASLARGVILEQCQKPSAHPVVLLKEAIVAANERIYAEKQHKPQYSRMACVVTLALADVQHNKFYYAHVGDTRLYLLRDETLVKVTKDQSFVGFLEDSGRLSEQEAMIHPRRNEIDKALGFDAQMVATGDYVETGESPFLPGDMILLCSDGLTDMITREQITTVLKEHKTLPEKGTALIHAANEAGGNDNITVVLVQNNKRTVKQKAIQPVAVKKNEVQAPEPVQQPAPAAEPITPTRHKSNKGVILLLSCLCVLLLCGFLWLLWQKNATGNVVQTAGPPSLKPEEKKLVDALNAMAGKTLVLSDNLFTQEIIISDTIMIEKDSLHLKGGSHTVFVRDSAFAGPAFMLSRNSRYVLLENVTLEYFDIGILAQNKVLQLKNVRFKDCRVPVRYDFFFSGEKAVSGTIADTAIFK